jgi:hypothetical protein
MSVFALPADFDLSDHFDHTTLMRAIGLKPPEALLSQHPEGETLHTRLRGNGATVYEQTISFFTDPMTGLHLRGLCTCPVGFNCQHVGAALMAYEAGLARARRLGLSVEEVMPDGGAPVLRHDPAALADVGLDPAALDARWIYLGDSPNDAGPFAAMSLSVGVHGVERFTREMPALPKFLALRPAGEALSEVVDALAMRGAA